MIVKMAVMAAATLVATCANAQMFDADQYGSLNLKRRQATTRVLEGVINREPPRYEPMSVYPDGSRVRRMGRPVGRLDIQLEKGTVSCTASLLGAEHLITNNHCVPGSGEHGPVKKASVVFGYYSEAGRGAERFEVDVKPLESSAPLDYSILKVHGNPAAKFGTIKLAHRDPVPGEALFVVHHPGGAPKHVTRGGCHAARPDALLDTDIFHFCDTIGGSSGAPIFADDDNVVIALHYGGREELQTRHGLVNYGKRITRIAQVSPIVAKLLGLPPPAVAVVTPLVTLTLANGARYTGSARAGVPHGRGLIEYSDGARYVGEFEHGVRHGQGTFTNKDGNRWSGTFKSDVMSGRFRVDFADGSVLNGADLEDGHFAGLALCNLRGQAVFGAVGFKRGEDWIGKGWYTLEPKQCHYLVSGKLSSRNYYYRVELETNEVTGGTHLFCLHPTKAFEMADAARCPTGGERRGFAQIDLGEGDKRKIGAIVDIPK